MSSDKTIRRAQAIHPYGPGAILDWGQECFVMLDTSSRRWHNAPEIRLERLERYLRVERFRQPPIKKRENPHNALPVHRFPKWLFCPKCGGLHRWTTSDEEARELAKEKLPTCKRRPKQENFQPCGGTLVPMRYVAACENGHLMDINWGRWVHANTGRFGVCKGELEFVARPEKGSSLGALEIRCTNPNCGAARSLDGLSLPGALERIGQRCSGRQPWQRRDSGDDCAEPLKPLLRSQTAVHFPAMVAALDLTVGEPDEDDASRSVVLEEIRSRRQRGDEIEDFTDRKCRRIAEWASHEVGRTVAADLVRELVKTVFGEGGSPFVEPKERSGPNWSEFLREEWDALTHPNKRPGVRAPLMVAKSNWSREGSALGRASELIKEVLLIERLREVRAFTGFNRLNTNRLPVRPNLSREHAPTWLPATEVYGEGIFLKFSQEHIQAWESRNALAIKRRLATVRKGLEQETTLRPAFADALPVLPRFIMIHTFSHLLMRQLCFECGYHGASIRERLYVFPDRAGVLIYTADGDSEGSLGGLVRQGRADRLSLMVAAALERGSWCSNDPICGELPPHGLYDSNRGACHACALVPETSCTHINSLLDRGMVIGQQVESDCGLEGFFQPVITDLK